MSAAPVTFVCPSCKGGVALTPLPAYVCDACGRQYPVVCGIPDFRLEPDPYISMEADRAKGAALADRARELSFEQLLRWYYAITPEDPADLAERWIQHALAEVDIADRLIHRFGLLEPANSGLLDVGCSTGALLVAARRDVAPLVGVDVAFRWLVVGQARLKEAGVRATLVCANAEHLPFAPGAFGAVTCVDTLEHVRDAGVALQEACRVLSPGGRLACEANNRWAPLPEPHVKLWGVAWLPRARQARYVARRRPDLHPYRICLRGARELAALAARAGWCDVTLAPAPLVAPHLGGAWSGAIAIYNRLRMVPPLKQILTLLGPRLRVTAARRSAAPAAATAAPAPSPSAAAPADT